MHSRKQHFHQEFNNLGPLPSSLSPYDTSLSIVSCVVVFVVLTLTRIIKSVATRQAPVTLELRNTLGNNTNKPKVVHAYHS